MIRYIAKSEYKCMPWKNGLGMTSEIAVEDHKPARDDSPFLWRVSIAGVDNDGAFSNFPNIDRHLMLLEGNGITLDGGEHGIGVLFEKLQVYSFAGDIEVAGRLADGPIRDLNLMVDRRFGNAALSGFYVDAPQRVIIKSSINIIHLLSGSAPVTLDVEGQLMTLAEGDSIEFKNMNVGANILQAEAADKPSALVFMAINL